MHITGYYRKNGHCYSDGWIVIKWDITYDQHLSRIYYLIGSGDTGCCNAGHPFLEYCIDNFQPNRTDGAIFYPFEDILKHPQGWGTR